MSFSSSPSARGCPLIEATSVLSPLDFSNRLVVHIHIDTYRQQIVIRYVTWMRCRGVSLVVLSMKHLVFEVEIQPFVTRLA